jgi:hypothetical protein
MQLNGTVNAQNAPGASTRNRFFRRTIAVAAAASVAGIVTATITRTVTADEDGPRACSERTLRGDYGILGSGIRAAGPGATESFVATGLRTYDGVGGFTQVINSHGQLTGAQRNVSATGTYEVSADCTGTSTILFPGAPFPIEVTFVIVDRGEEVKEAVMSPQPNVVMAVIHRVGR